MTYDPQQNLALIQYSYQGEIVRQRSRDGYMNATAMCKAAGREFKHYNENKGTHAFLVELASEVGIPTSELIQSLKGGNPALQGTWVHPQVAIHLAQWLSPPFAVRVSKWIYDWLAGGAPANESWLIFQERISLVYDNVPAGFFCIFKESADLYAAMIKAGAHMGARMILDISIGFHWGARWKENNFNERFGDRRIYPHEYPIRYPQSRSNPQEAKCYPDDALPEFRRWMREEYVVKHLPAYLQTLVNQGKLAAAAADQTLIAVEDHSRRRTRVLR